MNVWRAPLANETDEWTWRTANIENATEGMGHMASTEWYSAGLDRMTFHLEEFRWEMMTNENACITVKNVMVLGNGKGAFLNHFRYIIKPDGELIVEHSVIPSGNMPSWLPRIGLSWVLDQSLDNVTWYGRGPEENYPDRKSGYKIGIYEFDREGDVCSIPDTTGLRITHR